MNGDGDDRYDRLMEKRVSDLEADVDSLKMWRNWVLGIVAGIGLMTGAFAKNIGEILRHMGG